MRTQYFAALLVSVSIFAPLGSAKNKKAKADPKDSIEVVGHIPVTDGPVNRFISTTHYSSVYLYAEHETGAKATLIDITKINSPAVLGDVTYPANGASGNLTVVAGTAALVSSESTTSKTTAAQTIRVMDFSDPQNPKVAREFTGVTAMSRDDKRGLIFLANGDGIWILQQHFAMDPKVEEAYYTYILNSH